jgi:hypothetical protein
MDKYEEFSNMRSKTRPVLLALGIVVAAPLLSILTPAPAHADTCYFVTVGPQTVEVCP